MEIRANLVHRMAASACPTISAVADAAPVVPALRRVPLAPPRSATAPAHIPARAAVLTALLLAAEVVQPWLKAMALRITAGVLGALLTVQAMPTVLPGSSVEVALQSEVSVLRGARRGVSQGLGAIDHRRGKPPV